MVAIRVPVATRTRFPGPDPHSKGCRGRVGRLFLRLGPSASTFKISFRYTVFVCQAFLRTKLNPAALDYKVRDGQNSEWTTDIRHFARSGLHQNCKNDGDSSVYCGPNVYGTSAGGHLLKNHGLTAFWPSPLVCIRKISQ